MHGVHLASCSNDGKIAIYREANNFTYEMVHSSINPNGSGNSGIKNSKLYLLGAK